AGECVAVGDYNRLDSSGTELETAVIETLSGGAWTAAEAPLPPDAADAGSVDQGMLFDVSCPVQDSCVAVGRYHNAAGEYRGMIATLRDGTWSAAGAPELPGDEQSVLQGVDCSASGSCIAVGESSSGGVVETLSKGTWQPELAPPPAG